MKEYVYVRINIDVPDVLNDTNGDILFESSDISRIDSLCSRISPNLKTVKRIISIFIKISIAKKEYKITSFS